MTSRHEVELLGMDACGVDTLIVRFSRPAGYEFSAGQWFRLTLATDQGDVTETFSHCSAPSDPLLEMATRRSGSPFKRALAALEPGTRATIAGPGGHLALPEGADRITCLVGGVGITPVRSILRDARARDRVFSDALVLYGNRDETCVPFSEELLAMGDLGVRTVVCLERASDAWTGERGFITAETVRRYMDPADGRLFLLAGPPAMVGAMEHVLDELEVAQPRRLLERFGEAAG